jgi:NADPH:quinone reductase-like Zn-dependent oxidoreductase
MRAVVMHELGGPEVLRVEDVSRPDPIPTEILVRVHAAGVNPVDWKTRARGGYLESIQGLPWILGWDVAGVVEELGPDGVTRFAPGDTVLGMPWFPRQAGAYAEYVTAPARHFAAAPAGLDHEHAAGLPLAGLTAWQALVDTAGIGEGDRILIHAAAGGVGHLAVQVAKARGAEVIGTARAENHDFLRSLGIDRAIDYTAEPFDEAVSEVDVVLDLVGGEDYGLRSLRTLRKGGSLIVAPADVTESVARAAAEQGKRALEFLVEPDHAGLEALTDLIAAGRLRVEVPKTLPLEDASRAHQLGEGGRTRGKLVLRVR